MKKILLCLLLAFSASQACAQDDEDAKAHADAKEQMNYQLIKGAANQQKANETSDQSLHGYEKAAEKANAQYNAKKGSTGSGGGIPK